MLIAPKSANVNSGRPAVCVFCTGILKGSQKGSSVDRPDTDASASLLVLLAGPFLLRLGIGMLRAKGSRETLFSPATLLIGALICIAAAAWTIWAQLTLGKSVLQAAPVAVLLSLRDAPDLVARPREHNVSSVRCILG